MAIQIRKANAQAAGLGTHASKRSTPRSTIDADGRTALAAASAMPDRARNGSPLLGRHHLTPPGDPQFRQSNEPDALRFAYDSCFVVALKPLVALAPELRPFGPLRGLLRVGEAAPFRAAFLLPIPGSGLTGTRLLRGGGGRGLGRGRRLGGRILGKNGLHGQKRHEQGRGPHEKGDHRKKSPPFAAPPRPRGGFAARPPRPPDRGGRRPTP